MNNKVLFVLGKYSPLPSANGICVSKIQYDLLLNGISSDVICMNGSYIEDEVNEYGNIYHICQNEKKSYLGKIERFINWPLGNINEINLYKKKLKQVLAKNQYDAVIPVIMPVSCAIACLDCDNLIIYELDSVSNNVNLNRTLFSIYKKKCKRIEKKIYDKAKMILHLICNKQYYDSPSFNSYKNKSYYIDIPLLEKKNVEYKCKNNESKTLLYTGTLQKGVRVPDYVFDIVKRVKNKNFVIKFFSNGDCEDDIKKFELVSNGLVKRCGFISPDKLEKEMVNADCFLNIGLESSKGNPTIPSKIFQYISYQKPIINIIGNGIDTSIPYLREYGACLFIDKNESLDINVEKFERFIELQNIKINVNIFSSLAMNYPSYTTKIIMDYINKEDTL